MKLKETVMANILLIFPSNSIGNGEARDKIKKAKNLLLSKKYDLLMFCPPFDYYYNSGRNPLNSLLRSLSIEMLETESFKNSLQFFDYIFNKIDLEDSIDLLIPWYIWPRIRILLWRKKMPLNLVTVTMRFNYSLLINILAEPIKFLATMGHCLLNKKI